MGNGSSIDKPLTFTAFNKRPLPRISFKSIIFKHMDRVSNQVFYSAFFLYIFVVFVVLFILWSQTSLYTSKFAKQYHVKALVHFPETKVQNKSVIEKFSTERAFPFSILKKLNRKLVVSGFI